MVTNLRNTDRGHGANIISVGNKSSGGIGETNSFKQNRKKQEVSLLSQTDNHEKQE